MLQRVNNMDHFLLNNLCLLKRHVVSKLPLTFVNLFLHFARAYINVMRLCAPLFVCWLVSKNREGFEKDPTSALVLTAHFFQEEVLERVSNDLSTSTCSISHAMGSNHSSMLRVLQEQNLHVYHLQKAQGLGPNDFAPRVRFIQWFLQRSIVNPAFLVYWWGLLHKRWLLQQQKQPHLGRRESAHSVHQSSPGEIQRKHLGWNSEIVYWDLSSFQTVWMGLCTCNSSRTRFRCSWRRYPLRYA